jgi:hypothetical protein
METHLAPTIFKLPMLQKPSKLRKPPSLSILSTQSTQTIRRLPMLHSKKYELCRKCGSESPFWPSECPMKMMCIVCNTAKLAEDMAIEQFEEK